VCEIDSVARRKDIAATSKTQADILSKMVSLRQEESLAKLSSFMPVALQISQDLGLVPVPIGIDSVLMDSKKTINLGHGCKNFNCPYSIQKLLNS
jgi:hypothetical protein